MYILMYSAVYILVGFIFILTEIYISVFFLSSFLIKSRLCDFDSTEMLFVILLWPLRYLYILFLLFLYASNKLIDFILRVLK